MNIVPVRLCALVNAVVATVIVAIVTCESICVADESTMGTHKVSTQKKSIEGVGDSVFVASIPSYQAMLLCSAALKEKGIHAFFVGSLGYATYVRKQDRCKAIQILRLCAKRNDFHVLCR